jgi:hypothetical protein
MARGRWRHDPEDQLLSTATSKHDPAETISQGWVKKGRSHGCALFLWRSNSRHDRRHCRGVMLESHVVMGVTAPRTTASAKEQK